jgi:hypothetical protein
MHVIVVLIIALSALSFQAQAEDVVTVSEESPTSIEMDTITNKKAELIPDSKGNPTEEPPVVIVTNQPVGESIEAALAAPDDPYVEGKGLNTDEGENPDEADEDGEEDGDEEGEEDDEDPTDAEED